MYLPDELPAVKVLITVKTYPRPTPSYEEIVCTAGVSEEGNWIRIYPIPFRDLPYEKQFNKFVWIRLDLKKSSSDTRSESYQPKRMFEEDIEILEKVGTKSNWLERKRFVLKNVQESMQGLINLSYSEENKSLATLKPTEIIDFVIEQEEQTEWDKKYTERLKQMNLFQDTQRREIVKRLPYRYSYKFLSRGDSQPRNLGIHDWEIGALYWSCLKQTEGDSHEANRLVRKKYFDDFTQNKDLYFFLGTTYQFHKRKAPNPFSIIGVFYPPKTPQIALSI